MKKRFTVLAVSALMCVSLAFLGCGNNQPSEDAGSSENTDVSASNGQDQEVQAVNPADFLSSVWASYSEEDMFPIAGGDMEHANMDQPDVYDVVANKEAFAATYLVPDQIIADISGQVITLQHMMNTNTFCCAAFNVSDSAKISEYAEVYKTAIQSNQWMCGMPDTVVVMSDGNMMIVAYGEAEIIDTFKNKCMEADAGTKVVVEAPAVEG